MEQQESTRQAHCEYFTYFNSLAQTHCLTAIDFQEQQLGQNLISAGMDYGRENQTEDSSVQFSLYLSHKKFRSVFKDKNQDHAYWQQLLDSPHLNEEEKFLIRLRNVEHLPWRDIQIAFNRERGTNMKQPALRMRMRRTIERMKRLGTENQSNSAHQPLKEDSPEIWATWPRLSEMGDSLQGIKQVEAESLYEKPRSDYSEFTMSSSELNDYSQLTFQTWKLLYAHWFHQINANEIIIPAEQFQLQQKDAQVISSLEEN